MKLIKPHLPEFYYHYWVEFDGNNWSIRYRSRHAQPWDRGGGKIHTKWECFIRLFFWRLYQHRDLARSKRVEAQQLQEPEVYGK